MHFNTILDELMYNLKDELENESGLINVSDDFIDRDEDFSESNDYWVDGDLDSYIGKSL